MGHPCRYIVMELCEGSVKDYVEGNLKQIPKDSLDEKILVGQVALGLAYIHDKGIIHKDLKLENILLKRHSPRLVLAKIADFGFAKELKPGKTEFSETEHPGTETYMAPELLSAPGETYPVSFASDVYALGITIARIVLKGEHPFSSNRIRRQISMIKGLVPPNLQNLSWDLIDLILKLTEKDPGKRPEMTLVLRHPYFALTNDITKRHFADQLWTDFNSILNAEEYRIKKIRKVFSSRSFREWYETFSNKDNLAITDEEINEIENNIPLFTKVCINSRVLRYYILFIIILAKTFITYYSHNMNVLQLKPEMKIDSLDPAKGYMKIINEAVTSEYDIEIGDTINRQVDQLGSLLKKCKRMQSHNTNAIASNRSLFRLVGAVFLSIACTS
jgi:serine/threonine protein kinase